MEETLQIGNFHLGNLCKTLRKYIIRHDKGKSMVNLDIANALGQNLANSESCPILRLLFLVICQKTAMFEQLNDQLLVNSKISLTPH